MGNIISRKKKVSRRQFLRYTLGGSAMAIFGCQPMTQKTPGGNKRPNILVICSDQHHPLMTGYRGHRQVKTPNLDRLAQDGTHFTRAYVNCPVCGPSRMSFMTGKYVHQIENWYNCVPLPEQEKGRTWAARLDKAAIPSTCIGKIDSAGRNNDYNPGFTDFQEPRSRKAFVPYPRVKPFDQRLAGYTRPSSRKFLLEAGGGSLKAAGNPLKYNSKELGHYGHDRQVTNKALKYLREKGQDDSNQPWALYLGYLYPHWPYRVPQKYFDMYYPDNISMPHDAKFPNPDIHPAMQEWQRTNVFGEVTDDMLRRTISAYYGMITCMDEMIGEVIDELKREGLYDNTYIIYTSDHGESMGEHGLFFKHCAYEGSVGVPLVIKGPDIPAGKKIEDQSVSLIDLYPTILEIAGLESEPELPGASWIPLACGKDHKRTDIVFSEWHGAAFRGAWYMLVRDDYKYIWYEFHRPSLFNLKKDPKEEHDLASDPAHEKRLASFEKALYSILDPKATAMRAKCDLGLITPDGKDMTDSLTQWPGFRGN